MKQKVALLLVSASALASALYAQCPVTSLRWPLPGTFDPSHILLTFGAPWLLDKPCGGLTKIHTGLDYSEPVGTPVTAAAAGYVRIAQYSGPEFQSWIVIDHGCYTTVYWHINPLVSVGQWVNAGDQIATVAVLYCNGNPCSHLHFGIRDASYTSTPNSPDIASRGALPQAPCVTIAGRPPDPAFPEYFQDPLTVNYSFQGNCPPLSCCVGGSSVSDSSLSLFSPSPSTCVPGLSVSLAASPVTGSAPLNGVTLTAALSGSTQQTINYTFYCDRADDGVDITNNWNAKVDTTYANPLASPVTCTYPVPGIYHAKVIAEQGMGAVQAHAQINVGQVTPNCYPLVLARNTAAGGGIPTAVPLQSAGCGASQYAVGESIQVTAYPANGWGIGSWAGTQNDGSTGFTNSVLMPAGSYTVTVNYSQLSQGGGPLVSTGGFDGVTATSALLHGSANPNGGTTTLFFEYGTDVTHSVTSTAAQVVNGTSATAFAETATGLTCGTTYTYYAVASSSAGTNLGQQQIFTTSPCSTSSAPTIIAESADGISQTTAVLHSLVNPNGLPSTANFQYGTSPAVAVTSTPLESIVGSVSSAQIASAIGGLMCGTNYTYYAIGTNSTGTRVGPWQDFTTLACTPPPSVTSEWVDSITAGSAMLWAWVDPHNQMASTYFQYGIDPVNSVTSTPSLVISGLAEPDWPIGGLSCGTTYGYDAVISSGAGTTIGPWQTFMTGACGPSALPAARDESADAVDQTSATFNASVNPNGAMTVAYFEYHTNGGPISSTTAQFLSPGTNWVAVSGSVPSGGLSCGTTYYYATVAYNPNTSQAGFSPWQTFTTAPCTPAGSSFYTLTPCRVLDTRPSNSPISADSGESIQITGNCGIPSTATAVALNVTAVGATSQGILSVYPLGSVPPNYTVAVGTGQTRAASTVIGLSPYGTVMVAFVTTSGQGQTNFLIDVTGYFQ